MRVGRYLIHQEIAAGGMATVHLGRLLGSEGFARTVAIKRLHPQYAKDPEFTAMLLDEARLAGRIRHPNVVTTFDVVSADGELFLVMEYVTGDAFSSLLRQARKMGDPVSPAIVSAVVGQALLGLQAAHDAVDERGRPLELVHRDVSPQNIIVGVDGTARMVDFGVAKAASRIQTTSDGQLKGKLAYMSPEQLLRRPVDHRADLFAAGVVIWEALVGERLFASDDPGGAIARILSGDVPPPSEHAELPPAVDEFIARALASRPADRFVSAREMVIALHDALPPASSLVVGEWVSTVAQATLAHRERLLAELERGGQAEDEAATAASSPSAVVPTSGPDDATRVDPVPAALAAAPPANRWPTLAGGALVAIVMLIVSFVAYRSLTSPAALRKGVPEQVPTPSVASAAPAAPGTASARGSSTAKPARAAVRAQPTVKPRRALPTTSAKPKPTSTSLEPLTEYE